MSTDNSVAMRSMRGRPVYAMAAIAVAIATVCALLFTLPTTAHATATAERQTDSVMSLSYTDAQGVSQTAYYNEVGEAFAALAVLDSSDLDVKLELLDDVSYTNASGSTGFQILSVDFDVDLAGHTLSLVNEGSSSVSFLDLRNSDMNLLNTASEDARISATGFSTVISVRGSQGRLTMSGGEIQARTSNGSDQATAINSFHGSTLTVRGGTIDGSVQTNGTFDMSGGLITGDGQMLLVRTYTRSNEPDTFTITGGTIQSTAEVTDPSTADEQLPSAVSIVCASTTVSITGGTIEALNGSALRLKGGLNGGRFDESSTAIGGTARLSSENGDAVHIAFGSSDESGEGSDLRHVVRVYGDAELSGGESVFTFYDPSH